MLGYFSRSARSKARWRRRAAAGPTIERTFEPLGPPSGRPEHVVEEAVRSSHMPTFSPAWTIDDAIQQ
jgi:hypothetical protein